MYARKGTRKNGEFEEFKKLEKEKQKELEKERERERENLGDKSNGKVSEEQAFSMEPKETQNTCDYYGNWKEEEDRSCCQCCLLPEFEKPEYDGDLFVKKE
jgi:hypothetical protein